MATWLQGKIVEKKQWCTNLCSLKISTSPLHFKAGQFVNVGLDIDNKVLARPYSLINTPQDSLLEIYFTIVDQGRLSPRLAALVTGDTLQVSDRIGGLLTIDEVPDVPYLWLFATGTGIGPFLSMLNTQEPWQRFKKIILAYSVATLERLVYRSDFETLQSQHPEQFCFISYVTREKAADSLHSRITTSIEDGQLEKRAGLELSSDLNHFMLCGNSKMIGDVTMLLNERGMRIHTRREPGHIAKEKYY